MPRRINTEKFTTRHVTVILLKTKGKEKILEAERIATFHVQGNSMIVDF